MVEEVRSNLRATEFGNNLGSKGHCRSQIGISDQRQGIRTEPFAHWAGLTAFGQIHGRVDEHTGPGSVRQARAPPAPPSADF
jgi:hypothetical protein